jgi:hypothetical protein
LFHSHLQKKGAFMKKLMLVSLLVVGLMSMVSANFYGTVSAVKDGASWKIHDWMNDWQSNPNAAKLKPAEMTGKLIKFESSDVYVCVAVYLPDANGAYTVRYNRGNDQLPTAVNWSNYEMVGTLTLPAEITNFKLVIWATAPGQSPATEGCVFVNTADPAAVKNSSTGKPEYQVVCKG